MLSAKRESLTSLSIWIPFISFCCLIVVARTFGIMLNNSAESGHSLSCSWSQREGCQLFPIEDDICCGFFTDRFDEVQECSLYPCTLKCFNQEWCWILSNVFLHQLRGPYSFSLFSYWFVLSHWLICSVEPPLLPRNESHLVMVDDLFNVLLDPIS